ncbi:YeiH family protein [Roseiterribacter gracilis]|uniref:UPF0324 membrane protein n=1 Tax=Roseiterribacter gracilis TaxID=2812848 RepID=A0A8S8XAZ8_9PROT|nr:UPF0324 membrane protein [Rhodospirillales bacterium TMPK1]
MSGVTSFAAHAQRLVPGLVMCALIVLAAAALEMLEVQLFGRAWIERLVLAILIGALVRSLYVPGPRVAPGIRFAAKTVLEVAVVLLGASLSVTAIVAAGPALLIGILAIVVLTTTGSYYIGRGFALPWRMAVLVACGNAICGNSAIAAVAPVIGANGKDIASSIAFTAVLGVVVVLCLPLLIPLFGLTGLQYGALAGLTVYAVPQVLAATAPVSPLAVQIGTLVKLVRVLMLGPVIIALSFIARRRAARDALQQTLPRISQVVPWFIVGFLALFVLRWIEVLPRPTAEALAELGTALTVLSMAALGLGVDARSVVQSGTRVSITVVLSLLMLGVSSLALVYFCINL